MTCEKCFKYECYENKTQDINQKEEYFFSLHEQGGINLMLRYLCHLKLFEMETCEYKLISLASLKRHSLRNERKC